MKCFVCGHNMEHYFSKRWEDLMIEGEFVKCPNCGLVVNKTVYEMSPQEWGEVSIAAHRGYQGTNKNDLDPKWIGRLKNQATLFAEMFDNDIFAQQSRIVDYGCGDAKLSSFFKEKVSDKTENILCYDKYMKGNNFLNENQMINGSFDAVVSCSVYEHLIGINDVENIYSLLSKNGVFCLHTLICENIPKDPDWFYLLIVHCTLWTNKSMQITFNRYGFKGCAYHTGAQMWFFFRDKEQYEKLKDKKECFTGEWVFSDDFVDYWKQEPYRD